MFSPARIIKGLILFLLIAFTMSSFPAHTFAYTNTSTTNNAPATNLDSNVPDDQHTKIQTLLIDTLSAVMCQLVGLDPVRPQHGCISFNPHTGKFGYAKPDGKGGLLGTMGRMIGSTYQIPVHGSDYTTYLASNFGITKKIIAAEPSEGPNGGASPDAQAVGTGFSSMRSLLGIWTRLRDLTYLIFVVVFVLIGLGIMLRIKFDPRAVMTIQNQIPRIMVCIILITFSYAIAGFLIDVMWLSTYLGINVIASQSTCSADNLTSVATNNLLTTPFQYVGAILKVDGCPVDWGIKEMAYTVGLTIGDVITSVISSIFGTDGQSYAQSSCSSWDPTSWGTCIVEKAEDIIYDFFSLVIGLIAALIVAIAIFAALFRVWVALLKSMIYAIMFTLMSPLWILLGLLPNTKNFGFEQWIRHIVSALAPFPAVAIMFVAAAVIANDTSINDPGGTSFFLPPLVANPGVANNIGMVIALGIILISPEIVNMVRDALKVSSSKYTPAITAGAAAGGAYAGAMFGKPLQYAFGKHKSGKWGPGTFYAANKLFGADGKFRSVGERFTNYRNKWKNAAWQKQNTTMEYQMQQLLKTAGVKTDDGKKDDVGGGSASVGGSSSGVGPGGTA